MYVMLSVRFFVANVLGVQTVGKGRQVPVQLKRIKITIGKGDPKPVE